MSKKNVHPIVSGAGWIGSFAGLLVADLDELGVSYEDIHKLGKPTNESRTLVRACAEKIAQLVRGAKSDFLKLISSLILDATDGSEILAEANDVFAFIDSDFKNWGADEKGPEIGETPVRVHEMVQNCTFSQMFGSLSSDVRKLCFTQAQIKGFVKKFRRWLRTDGYATLFLFESHDQFFVAFVYVRSDAKLHVFVARFGDSYVWYAECRRRVVVPQLA